MANENDVKIILDVDESKLKTGLSKAEKEVNGFAKNAKENLNTLTKAFKFESFADFAAGIYVAKEAIDMFGKAINAAFDLVLEGEKITAINAQFEMLSNGMGLSAEKLRNGLMDSVSDLAGGEEVLQAASQAMIKLGDNAERLPELMDIARKSAMVSGKDMLEVFDALTQSISTGQTKALKTLGISVDVKKVNDEYAKSLGISANALTENQKQHALLNEVLDIGAKKYKNIDVEITPVSNSWKRLTEAIGEAKDELALFLSQNTGGFFKGMFDSVTEGIKSFTKSDDLDFKIKSTIEEVTELTNKLNNLSKINTLTSGFKADKIKERISFLKEELAQQEAIKNAIKEAATIEDPRQRVAALGAGKDMEQVARFEAMQIAQQEEQKKIAEANQKKLELERAFQGQLIGMKDQELQMRISAASLISDDSTRRLELEKIQNEQLVQESEKYNQKINEIETQYSDIRGYNAEQRRQMELEAATLYTMTKEKILIESENRIKQEDAKSFADKQKSLSSFASAFGSAFGQMGKAMQKGEDALKSFADSMLASLGQMAIQMGTQFMLTGAAAMWAPVLGSAMGIANPAGLIAAGAAMAVFGGILSGMGGGSSSIAGGDTSTSTPTPVSDMTPITENLAPEEKKTEVSVVVQGNILNTRESALHITELLNDAFNGEGLKFQGAV